MILFSAKVSDKHKKKLKKKYPKQVFVFGNNMNDVKENISEAEVIVTFGGDITADLMKKAHRLKWIMVMSAGVEKLPFSAIREKGVLVTNVRGIHKIPMAEYAISMVLQVYRQAKAVTRNQERHIWDQSVRMKEITGKTMLIVGTGAIGQEVARLAKAFQMRTIGISRSGRTVTYFDENDTNDNLNKFLHDADFVISVLPGTPETKGLFTYEDFQQMPNHAVFLNMGRGNVVQSDVILKAVQKEEIAHAVLDVFEEEPLPEAHPFWLEENITVTPHISGVSSDYMLRGLDIFEQNLNVFLSEKETGFVNQIDLVKGY